MYQSHISTQKGALLKIVSPLTILTGAISHLTTLNNKYIYIYTLILYDREKTNIWSSKLENFNVKNLPLLLEYENKEPYVIEESLP